MTELPAKESRSLLDERVEDCATPTSPLALALHGSDRAAAYRIGGRRAVEYRRGRISATALAISSNALRAPPHDCSRGP
jgi:hypothetical protein